jgi:hypothetical protein
LSLLSTELFKDVGCAKPSFVSSWTVIDSSTVMIEAIRSFSYSFNSYRTILRTDLFRADFTGFFISCFLAKVSFGVETSGISFGDYSSI